MRLQQAGRLLLAKGLVVQATPPPLPLPAGPNEYPTCQLSDDIGYVLYSALGSFFIPCDVMIFTYIKIFLAARSRAINKSARAHSAAVSSTGADKTKRGAVSGPKQMAEACTITTSGAKQASPSALNGAASTSNESSMITVMSASTAELPVTRFNFKRDPASPRPEAGPAADDRTAALLRAINQVAADQELLRQVMASEEATGGAGGGEQVPDIVVERRVGATSESVIKLLAHSSRNRWPAGARPTRPASWPSRRTRTIWRRRRAGRS